MGIEVDTKEYGYNNEIKSFHRNKLFVALKVLISFLPRSDTEANTELHGEAVPNPPDRSGQALKGAIKNHPSGGQVGDS
jgi:hypothetical protein